MKRFFTFLLILCLTLALITPVMATETEEPVTSGTCGKDITWVFDTQTGTLTLTGTGHTKTYYKDGILSKQAPWAHLREQITTIVVGEGITSLYSAPFCHCTNLTSVSLPSTLVKISDYIFYGCKSLTSIELPASLQSMGSEVFKDCTNLVSCSIPESMTRIPTKAFEGCGFTEFTVPDNITSIGASAFHNCMKLETVHLPETMKTIEGGVFNGCRALKTIELPDGIRSIGANTFKDTPLTEIVIPDGVTELGEGAFAYCIQLTQVTLPDSVSKIGIDCFLNCTRLAELDLPAELKSIGFQGLRWTNAERFVLPHGTKSIGAYAFDHSPRLTEVVIPCTVSEIGEKIFNNCTKDVRILCWKGTYAHSYAIKNNIPWSLMEEPCNDLPFTDVSCNDFFTPAVRWALRTGITNGISADTFGSMTPTNRAAAVTMLWRYAGCPEPTSTENPFLDVSVESYYFKAVLWALENGITNGISEDQFGPALSCNRAQIVTFLCRFRDGQAPEYWENPFIDVPVGSWYELPVLWARDLGITTGISYNEFDPNGDCLRSHFVTFLYRLEYSTI